MQTLRRHLPISGHTQGHRTGVVGVVGGSPVCPMLCPVLCPILCPMLCGVESKQTTNNSL